jgi:hypothetical protein
MKQAATRKFKMSDPDFVQKCDFIAVLVLRDTAKFLLYNYAVADLDRFKANVATFKELNTDEYWEGLKMEKTQAKADARAAVLAAVAPVRDRIKMKFGEPSAIYRSLRVGDITRSSDEALYFAAKRVHSVGTAKKTDLQSKGLTDAMLTALLNAIKGLDDAIDLVEKGISDRDEQTELRINMANSLYAEMVAICEIGKSAWVNESEAKYNDYVIYQPAAGKAILTGKVTDAATQAPVAKAMVELEETDLVTETDEQGNYLFADINPGVYTLLVDAENYKPYSQSDIHVRQDETVTVNVALMAGT